MISCYFISLLFIFCPTYEVKTVNKEYIGVYGISRYYTPIPGQKRYYLGRTYEEDLAMNTSGDPFVTADGYRLSAKDMYKVVACPPEIQKGTRIFIEGVGNVVCRDRGGSIKNKRLDLWVGIGDEGVNSLYKYSIKYAGQKNVYLVK